MHPRSRLLISLIFDFISSQLFPAHSSLPPSSAGAMPVIVNVTILNGMNVLGWIPHKPSWQQTHVQPSPSSSSSSSHPIASHKYKHAAVENPDILRVDVTHPRTLWPWSGSLGVFLRVNPSASDFSGNVSGRITFSVVSPPAPGEATHRVTNISLPVKAAIVPTPARERRVLWDQFHNVRYPPGYIPRDSLEVRTDILDWHADHPHTNFHDLFAALREWGYFLEILGSPFTCFDARQYGTLMLVDLEEEFYPEEVRRIRNSLSIPPLSPPLPPSLHPSSPPHYMFHL